MTEPSAERLSADQARLQRDNCKFCHQQNITNSTFMMPYCSGCLSAKEVLGMDWWEVKSE